MKEKFYRFMQGRYGNDDLSKFLVGVSMVLIILNLLTKSLIFNLLFWACLFYSYFRMFSKNHPARYAENQKFLGFRARLKYKVENHKKLREQKKIYHISRCNCKFATKKQASVPVLAYCLNFSTGFCAHCTLFQISNFHCILPHMLRRNYSTAW